MLYMSEEIPRPKTLLQETASIEPAESQERKDRLKNFLGAKRQLLTMRRNLSEDFSPGMSTLAGMEQCLNQTGRMDLVSRIISEALPAAIILNVRLAIEALGVEENPSVAEVEGYCGFMEHEVLKAVQLFDKFTNPRFYAAVVKLLTDYSFLKGYFRRIENYSMYKQTGNERRFREAEQRVKEEHDFNEEIRHLPYSDREEREKAREKEKSKRMRTPENIAAIREANSAFIEAVRKEKEFSINIGDVLQEIEQEIDKELAAG